MGLASILGAVTLAVLEGMARFVAGPVLKQGRLLQAEEVLGWRPLRGLELQRRNADGALWTVRTNRSGFRSADGFGPAPRCRLLVLGDSFAFGEGVEESERFDAVLARSGSDACATVNLGVPGYGTDQELLAAAAFLPELRAGDALLLVTYSNDFVDILRRRFAGRPKPWYELTPQKDLVFHPARPSALDRWRDRSYLWARLAALREPVAAAALDDPVVLERGLRLYDALVSTHLAPLVPRGVRVVLAFHGVDRVRSTQARQALRAGIEGVCARQRLFCLDLDSVLDRPRHPWRFLGDGHWTADGHASVAEAIGRALRPTGATP